ncbi:MAG: hypothetical protein ACK5NG_04540 [Chthoniobacterales bacterium]
MQRKKYTANNISAFTLIELSSVTAIIFILGFLGIGFFNKLKDKSQSVQCIANLRTLATGAMAFAGERNGVLWTLKEIGYSRFRMYEDPLGVPQILKDYVSNPKAWLCPAGRNSLTKFGNNYCWLPSKKDDGVSLFARKSSLAKIVLFYDAFIYSLPSMHGASDDYRGNGSIGPRALRSKFHRRPHNELAKANWVYADGHVETR